MKEVTNLQDLKKYYIEYTAKFQNLVVLDEQEKEYKELLSEIKKERTPLKNARVGVNKYLTAETKKILAEIDEVTKLLDEVIKPIETALNELSENRRIKRLNEKKEKFAQRLNELNEAIAEANQEYKLNIELVEFDENWVKFKDEDIDKVISDRAEQITNTVKTVKNNLKMIVIVADKLKNEYDLKSEIDTENIDITDIEAIETELEKRANKQQEIEINAEIAAKERLEREIKKEIETTKEEIKTNENIEVIEEKKEIENKKVSEKDVTLFFPAISKEKAKLLLKILQENEINYQVI